MNPKTWTQDDRRVVWTFSLDIPNTYCLYVQGVLTHENLTFEEWYPLYKKALADYT